MIINLESQTDLSGFYIVYEGSTNLEKPGWYGISHLMEHLMCKNFDHLQEDFDKDGIDWNAYTSSNEIVFYITGLDEKIEKWKYEFIDLMSGFEVTKEDFENEKKIVLEEYMDTFNDQTSSHQLNLNRKLFNDYSPIGLKQDLINLKFMDCLNFFELQYSKPSKIINVSKNKKYKNNLIEFSDRKIDKVIKYGNHEVEIETNNDFKDKSSLIMMSPIINKNFSYISFITSMMSLGLKSPLYQELREKKGLVYYIRLGLSRNNKKGIINLSTQTSNSNTDKVIKSVKKVFDNPNKFLTKERFNLIKEYYEVRLKKSEILRHGNVSRWINPESFSVYDILENVTLKKIKDVYKENFNIDDFYISNDKTEFK